MLHHICLNPLKVEGLLLSLAHRLDIKVVLILKHAELRNLQIDNFQHRVEHFKEVLNPPILANVVTTSLFLRVVEKQAALMDQRLHGLEEYRKLFFSSLFVTFTLNKFQ